jgi:hypothetical protein
MIIQEKTLEEHKKFVEKIMKRDLKRQKRIEAAGIEYECPDFVRSYPSIMFINSCCTSNFTLQKEINRMQQLSIIRCLLVVDLIFAPYSYVGYFCRWVASSLPQRR